MNDYIIRLIGIIGLLITGIVLIVEYIKDYFDKRKKKEKENILKEITSIRSSIEKIETRLDNIEIH